MIDILAQALAHSLSPQISEITGLFGSLNRLSPKMQNLLLAGLDEKVLERLGTWASTFGEHLNALDMDIDAVAAKRIIDPAISDDFMAVMAGTKYEGVLLTQADLRKANNIMTKAIKSNNWTQAIQVGMALAGALPV